MSERMTYRGTGVSDDDNCGLPLPDPPPWRVFRDAPSGSGPGDPKAPGDARDAGSPSRRALAKGEAYLPSQAEIDMVNAAMYLRRPLLVTGKPGVGKSSLAYSIARELRLGPVLRWSVTSRSTLREGLYQYDAIGRLQDANLRDRAARDTVLPDGGQTNVSQSDSAPLPDIGSYVRLGALGTALLPAPRPRVLLIDELDKGDIDLPNDLLDVFEEGEFEIPELARLPEEQKDAMVMTADRAVRAQVSAGRVRCQEFPVVILTSNGEREFPPAFLRRCLRLTIVPPDITKLTEIVQAHLGAEAVRRYSHLIDLFLERRKQGDLAADQLLNAIHLSFSGLRPDGESPEDLAAALLTSLGSGTG